MPAIFVSYRRDDSLSATGRLTADLDRAFGADEVFRDLDAIEPGRDFRGAIAEALSDTQVVLVVVGRSWLAPGNADRAARLFEADDYVRWEIERALTRALPIIPVLVEGAAMPGAERLPPSIHEFAFRQAHELSESRWMYDSQRLVKHLVSQFGLERIAEDGAASARSELIPRLLRIPESFIALLYRPRKILIERAREPRPIVDALLFWLVSSLAGGWLLSEFSRGVALWDFVMTAALLPLVASLYLSGPLYAAWRLQGQPCSYRQVLTIFLYQTAMVNLALALASLVMLGAFEVANPGLVNRQCGPDGARVFPRCRAAAVAGAQIDKVSLSGVLVATFLAGFAVVWFGASWGAYRELMQRSRVASLTAFALFAAFALAPVLALGVLVRLAL